MATPPSPGPPVPEPPPAPQPPPATPAPRLGRLRYLAFGDSLTAGTTSPALNRTLSAGLPQSYPFKLQEALVARYQQQAVAVENEGKPNEAAADAVTRFPAVFRATSPDVVILLHGVNDVTFLGIPGIPRVTGYLDSMARAARLGGASVIICTLPPHRAGGFRAADPDVIRRYNESLRDLARGEGALLVDFERDIDISLIGAVGLHPTEAGYARMAQVLFERIRDRFEVPSSN